MENLKSVEKRRSYCREFFSNLGTGVFLPNEDNAGLFNKLLSYHPQKEEKIGCGIKYFRLSENKLQPNSFHIDIIRKDGSSVSFSWRECCKLEKFSCCSKDKLTEAFRCSISPHILLYLNKNKEKICATCSSTENIQVDHIIPFSHILAGFISSKNSLDFPSEFDKNEFHQNIFKSKHISIQNDFIKYHNSRAIYQYLCRKCNVLKSDTLL